MSSSASTPPSINIYAAAKAYEARQQAAKDHSQSPMSSSSSTYSSSPQTPSSANASKSAQKQKQKAVHMRRQSLLSMPPSLLVGWLSYRCQMPHFGSVCFPV